MPRWVHRCHRLMAGRVCSRDLEDHNGNADILVHSAPSGRRDFIPRRATHRRWIAKLRCAPSKENAGLHAGVTELARESSGHTALRAPDPYLPLVFAAINCT